MREAAKCYIDYFSALKHRYCQDSSSGNFGAGSSTESEFEPKLSKAATPIHICLSHTTFAGTT